MSSQNLQKNNETQIIRTHYSYIDYIGEGIALSAVLFTFFTLILNWPSLPSNIPVHFDIFGTPVRWGSKTELLIEVIMGTLLSYVVLTAVSKFFQYFWKITPGKVGKLCKVIQSFFIWFKALIVGTLSFCTWKVIQIGLGKSGNFGTHLAPILLMLLLGLILVHIIKAICAK